MPLPVSECPVPSAATPQLLDLTTLHPRIARMVQEILRHQAILTAYDAGLLLISYNGRDVKPQIEKLMLNSRLEGE